MTPEQEAAERAVIFQILKSLEELQFLMERFQTNALLWPSVRKACMKNVRLVEKEIARREAPR